MWVDPNERSKGEPESRPLALPGHDDDAGGIGGRSEQALRHASRNHRVFTWQYALKHVPRGIRFGHPYVGLAQRTVHQGAHKCDACEWGSAVKCDRTYAGGVPQCVEGWARGQGLVQMGHVEPAHAERHLQARC